MNKLAKELLIFALDNIQGAVTNTPLDWRHSDVMGKVGVALNLLSYKEDLNVGSTLYYVDEWGYFHPSKDRLIPPSDEELKWFLDINEKIARLNLENKQLFDDFIQDVLPMTGNLPIGGSPHLDLQTNTLFKEARNFTPRRDPLVLDLDGDGLELKPSNGNLLFDHDADGIKTGTGWADADDGFLVRDLNGNGVIDSGHELFGEDTVKRNGQRAAQGFDALADLDTNGDGNITSADAAWSKLQVWRDLNQDGISQSHELSSLDALHITRIGVNGSGTGPQAGQTINHNRVALSTTFTRDGSDRTVGAIDLESNPFFSNIPAEHVDETGNPVTLTDTALGLPQMNGSGMVRNLRAAMSLSGAAADELEDAVAAFEAATTRDAQLAQVDVVITAWAQTSSYWSDLETTLGGSVTLNPPEGMSKAEYRNMIAVLEAFNGSRFYGAAGQAMPAGQRVSTFSGATTYTITPPANQVELLQQAYAALRESVYAATAVQTRLKPYLDSIELNVSEGGVSFDTTGLHRLLQQRYDESAQHGVEDLIELGRFANASMQAVDFPVTGLLREWSDTWPVDSPLRALLTTLDVFTPGATVGKQDVLQFKAGISAIDVSLSREEDHLMVKLNGNADQVTVLNYFTLDRSSRQGYALDAICFEDGTGWNARQVNAMLQPQAAGRETAMGLNTEPLALSVAAVVGVPEARGVKAQPENAVDDTLQGGLSKGNLGTLVNTFGGQTHLFGRGDGQSTLNNIADRWSGTGEPAVGNRDVLQFKAGVSAHDVTLCRSADNLIAQINGSTDQVTVQDYFHGGSAQSHTLKAVRFDDGTGWYFTQIRDIVTQPGLDAAKLAGRVSCASWAGATGNGVLPTLAGMGSVALPAVSDTLRKQDDHPSIASIASLHHEAQTANAYEKTGGNGEVEQSLRRLEKAGADAAWFREMRERADLHNRRAIGPNAFDSWGRGHTEHQPLSSPGSSLSGEAYPRTAEGDRIKAMADAFMQSMAAQGIRPPAETSFTPLQSSSVFPMISGSLN